MIKGRGSQECLKLLLAHKTDHHLTGTDTAVEEALPESTNESCWRQPSDGRAIPLKEHVVAAKRVADGRK